MIFHRTALVLLALAVCRPAFAEDSYNQFLSLQLENDLWGSNDDRFYTHGTKISWASNRPAPGWIRGIADSMPFYSNGEIEVHGYEIGQAIFTPEDIEVEELIEDDRPYAGWLYFNVGIGSIYADRGDRDRSNLLLLTIGIVGPSSYAEKTQRAVHDIVDTTDPQGWDNQLEDELGLNATYVAKRRRIYDFDERYQTELGAHYNLTLGNVYTYAAAGLTWRYGTRLKGDIGPPSILPGFPGAPAFNPNQKSNWYLFGGLELRAMARNIFLDGNSVRDSHSVDSKSLVADLQFGFAYHFGDVRLSFLQLFRTREFDEQSEPSRYGAINVTFFSE